MSFWIISALVWLAIGVLCYLMILRFFPPTPLIDDTRPETELRSRPFSLRNVPQLIFLVPTLLISPLLLFALACARLLKSKKSLK